VVELKATLTESGVLYLPQALREGYGKSRRLRILSNACSALLIPDSVDYEDALGSLHVIQADLEHRIYLEKKRKGRTE